MIITYNKEKYKEKYNDLFNRVFECYKNVMNINCKIEVNVSFVSPFKIKKINKINRNINKITDVLSFPTLVENNKVLDISQTISSENFPFDVNPETNAVVIGDIVFCMFRIKNQAKKYGNTLNRELGYMFVHGLLHLTGYDHINENDKKQMRIKEEEILNKINLKR